MAMDKIQALVPAVLIDAADKFVQAEKDLSRDRNERFKNRVLRIVRRAVNRYTFFGVCVIVGLVTVLLLNRSENAS